jgi:hypothetical protein
MTLKFCGPCINAKSQIRAALGGNLKLVVSGSAPISGEVLDFLKIALACEITEGKPAIHRIARTLLRLLHL